jgi:hypothetical protein
MNQVEKENHDLEKISNDAKFIALFYRQSKSGNNYNKVPKDMYALDGETNVNFIHGEIKDLHNNENIDKSINENMVIYKIPKILKIKKTIGNQIFGKTLKNYSEHQKVLKWLGFGKSKRNISKNNASSDYNFKKVQYVLSLPEHLNYLVYYKK